MLGGLWKVPNERKKVLSLHKSVRFPSWRSRQATHACMSHRGASDAELGIAQKHIAAERVCALRSVPSSTRTIALRGPQKAGF